MLILFETASGFALFKLLDKSAIKSVDKIDAAFQTPEAAKKTVSLKSFVRFENTQNAIESLSAVVEGKVSDTLQKFLKESMDKKSAELAVFDKALGSSIQDKLGITCIYDSKVIELMRGIRSQLSALLNEESSEVDLRNMSVGISHTLYRYKLKFTPDKVDTMIVQAISLLDDLDKELNIYAMRVKEWYGWHFPELAKIINDNILYAKSILIIKNRKQKLSGDLTDVLPEDMSLLVEEAIKISMGTEINEEDVESICTLAEEVVALSDYRSRLFEYLKNRMQAIAPNLTHVVGELVGARLISHAGSLINLAKQPSSTLQILGAEKALFRALKAKHNTPKYGLIYHASLIGQASNKNKGRIARVLAAKCSLSSRVDALGEKEQVTIGLPSKDIVENRLAVLEGLATKAVSALPKGTKSTKQVDRSVEHSAKLKTSNEKIHDDSMDVTVEKSKKRKRDDGSDEEEKKKEKKKEKKEKKDKEEKKEKKDKDEKKKEKKEKKDKEEKKDKKKKDK